MMETENIPLTAPRGAKTKIRDLRQAVSEAGRDLSRGLTRGAEGGRSGGQVCWPKGEPRLTAAPLYLLRPLPGGAGLKARE